MAKLTLHQQTLANMKDICAWFSQKTSTLSYPIYSSYDIRDSGYKITNVDANIFPAGFNNICPTDKESAVALMNRYLSGHYENVKNILLVTEEHTNNAFYWENVHTIRNLIEATGRTVKVAIPRELPEPLTMTSSAGNQVIVHSALRNGSLLSTFTPDLIVSNNDFSEAYEEWAQSVMDLPMNPAHELGWFQRKKSTYFKYYNELADEFAAITKIDPFLLRVETELFEHFDIGDEKSREALAARVDAMLNKLREEYKKRGIEQEPFVFVKNNAGTYGLAVIRVGSGAEVKEWSYKSRKKMKAAKGGRDVEEVIIQEGIPSIVQADGASAEPVIYMIGCELAGGFLRTHAEKSSTESLNSPGAVYKRLCVSDLAIDTPGCPQENVYGWTAKIGMLAIAKEAEELHAQFRGYKPQSACQAHS
ncbi:glutamate--cysteine ligase [Bdellovibrio bacteriovorus]|uniref:Glutamate--cysteine ligase n=1 Tax=Bdellovibrio bacteriovorus TaxID=959 RepID=A0A150WQH4_BDEBC|nr:glutamate--cysteine ligase [Bdellovibrio bacteriovorus]KYG66549.1 glutamate--cysteine ligase [Bdellovibrio bacteriovorus]